MKRTKELDDLTEFYMCKLCLSSKNLTEEQEILELRKRELGRNFNKNRGLVHYLYSEFKCHR